MKRYRTNIGLFIMLPAFVTVLILTYMTIIYSRSYTVMNIINIGIDGIILIYYFVNFSYRVDLDNEKIIFYTTFKKHMVKGEDFGFALHGAFLTKFICKKRNFYMLTTPKGCEILKNLMKDRNIDRK